jgi:hypothetical protein
LSNGQFIGPEASSLCSLGARPWILTGVLRHILIWHFAEQSRVEEPDLAQLLWQDADATGILIETLWKWQPQNTGKRPAVIIRRNAYRNLQIGISDRRQLPITDQYGYDYFATYWVGSHTLFCLGANGAQAELLATEVQRELTQYATVIRRALDLMKFQVYEVGPVSEVEEAQENAVVPVTVGTAYEERWLLRAESLPLRRLSLSLLADG